MKIKMALAAFAVAGAALSASAQDAIVFDSGYVNTCIFNAAVTRLGWSSGALPSASLAQRWAAQAFTLGAATHVTRIDPEGFVPAGSEFTNLKWVIFRRSTGNPAPTAADQVASGTFAYPGVIADDPRYDAVNNPNPNLSLVVAPITTDVQLAAGNYWLTVYGDTAVTAGADANFAWFTNAQLDTTLTPPNTPIVISDANGVFMWRSSAFPSPGFARYTTAAASVDTAPTYGPVPQDPQYIYNAAFQIRGTTGAAPCYANCDGSTIAPILNVNDFICFQTKYAQNDTYANCDGSTIPPVLNVNDFICFQTKYAQGCP